MLNQSGQTLHLLKVDLRKLRIESEILSSLNLLPQQQLLRASECCCYGHFGELGSKGAFDPPQNNLKRSKRFDPSRTDSRRQIVREIDIRLPRARSRFTVFLDFALYCNSL
ncbi:MAG: hypothetical protein SW833_08600 [Cyanobacteriota bacterium]|nr:hypothetical protein [Cyanobacteriota bacterium]